jgi:hypothetical protein
MKIVKAALFAGSLLAASLSSAAVLDFEGYAHGQIIDSQYQPLVTISANNLSSGPDLAVAFDSTRSNTADPDLQDPFYNNAADKANRVNQFRPGNILIIQENSNGCADRICNSPDDEGSRPAGSITFDFGSNVINLTSIDFFDIEGAETAPNAIKLFNKEGSEIHLNQFYVPDTGGNNLWKQVVFNAAGISKVEVNFGGSGALDNFVYSISEVPVPAAAFLFAPALLGFMGLRRKAKKIAA